MVFYNAAFLPQLSDWGWIKKAKVLHEWTAAVCHCLSEARHHCCPAVPLLQGQPVPVLPDYGWKPTQAPRGHQGDLHVGPEGLPGEHQKTLGQGRRDGHETGARRVATQDRAFNICVHSATVWLFFFTCMSLGTAAQDLQQCGGQTGQHGPLHQACVLPERTDTSPQQPDDRRRHRRRRGRRWRGESS